MPTTEQKGEWVSRGKTDGLPPALMVSGAKCHKIGMGGYYCTRIAGHTGRHAAEGTRFVLAVWN